MKNYPQLLIDQQLQLLEPYKGCKEKHSIQCLNCNNIFIANILGKIQAYQKFGKNGCPYCYKSKNLEKKTIKVNNIINEINQNGYQVLGEFHGNFYSDIFSKTKVKKMECGHVFDASLIYIKSSGFKHCKICWTKKVQNEDKFIELGFKPHTVSNVRYLKKGNIVIFIHDINNIVQKNIPNKDWMQNLNKSFDKKIKVLHFYSDEIRNNIDLFLNKIKHLSMQSDLPKVYARKCEIGEITVNEKIKFLNMFHNQGDCIGKINYGAYYNNELVAIMVFCEPRIFMNKKPEDGLIELARFATNTKYHVVGIASKLLSYFKNNNKKYTKITSYADRRYSMGNLYFKLGFTLENINKPNYFYIINGERKHRWKFRKDALRENFPQFFDPALTEYQNMLKLGYDRIWDCGTMKFTMTNSM